MQEKKNDAAEKTHKNGKVSNEKCHEHRKELNLFCFEDTCRVPICPSCLGNHIKHEINEIEAKEKEFLMRKLKRVKKDRETDVEKISKANNDVTNKGNQHIHNLKKLKEAFIEYIKAFFYQMITDTKYQCYQFEERVKEEVFAMRTKIELADVIEEQLKQVNSTNNEKIQDYCETVRDDIENHKPNLTGLRSVKFPVFNMDVENISSYVTNEEFPIDLPNWQEVEAEEIENQPVLRNITKPSQLRCTGTCVIFLF